MHISALNISAARDLRLCYRITVSGRDYDARHNSTPRLEALHKVFFKKGEEGDVEAGNWCLRRADRMSKWLGLDVMPRGEAMHDNTREPSSYQKITEALMTLKYGPTIEGEAVEDKGD